MRFLQVHFFTMAMVDFVRVRRPIHTAMVRKNWTWLRRFLTTQDQNPLPSHESLAMALKKSDGRGMSAVDRAAEVGVLRSLVANGADLDQEDNDGFTALDLAHRKCSEAGTMSSEKRSCQRSCSNAAHHALNLAFVGWISRWTRSICAGCSLRLVAAG